MSVTDYAPSKVDDALPVRDYLAGLGSSPDEVADTLRTMNVTGVRSFGTSCPISYALAHAGYGTWSVGVEESAEIVEWEEDTVEIESGTEYPVSRAIYGDRVNNPGPVREFILEFDKGVYPDLETDEVVVSTELY